MSENYQNNYESPTSYRYSSSESSAYYLNNSIVLSVVNTPCVYWTPSMDVYLSEPDILTDVQRQAFSRTMQKYKRGFELLAE